MSTVSHGLNTNASSVFFNYHRLPPRIESVVSRGYLDNISKKAARGDSNFMTPSTVTSPVFYFYESNKLPTNEHTTSSFHLQISWTMTIFVVAAYVLMISASCILLPTKVGNSYMSTQWSMESTFVKLSLQWNLQGQYLQEEPTRSDPNCHHPPGNQRLDHRTYLPRYRQHGRRRTNDTVIAYQTTSLLPTRLRDTLMAAVEIWHR